MRLFLVVSFLLVVASCGLVPFGAGQSEKVYIFIGNGKTLEVLSLDTENGELEEIAKYSLSSEVNKEGDAVLIKLEGRMLLSVPEENGAEILDVSSPVSIKPWRFYSGLEFYKIFPLDNSTAVGLSSQGSPVRIEGEASSTANEVFEDIAVYGMRALLSRESGFVCWDLSKAGFEFIGSGSEGALKVMLGEGGVLYYMRRDSIYEIESPDLVYCDFDGSNSKPKRLISRDGIRYFDVSRDGRYLTFVDDEGVHFYSLVSGSSDVISTNSMVSRVKVAGEYVVFLDNGILKVWKWNEFANSLVEVSSGFEGVNNTDAILLEAGEEW